MWLSLLFFFFFREWYSKSQTVICICVFSSVWKISFYAMKFPYSLKAIQNLQSSVKPSISQIHKNFICPSTHGQFLQLEHYYRCIILFLNVHFWGVFLQYCCLFWTVLIFHIKTSFFLKLQTHTFIKHTYDNIKTLDEFINLTNLMKIFISAQRQKKINLGHNFSSKFCNILIYWLVAINLIIIMRKCLMHILSYIIFKGINNIGW